MISELFGWFETRREEVTVNPVSDCYMKNEECDETPIGSEGEGD